MCLFFCLTGRVFCIKISPKILLINFMELAKTNKIIFIISKDLTSSES